MISLVKKALHINLDTLSHEVKSYPDYAKYIGGVGLGLKLLAQYREQEPLVFSVGPLNGFFPFASKTSIVIEENGVVEDLYIGGTLSFRIRYCGFDSILVSGRSSEPVVLEIQDEKVKFHPLETDIGVLGLPGKKSILNFTSEGLFLDDYFSAHGKYLEKRLVQKNVKSIAITGTKTVQIKNEERYYDLFNKILSRVEDLSVEKGDNPSCSGCPMGCFESRTGEIGGNLLVHSLVGCSFAEKIYSDIGTVFACLNSLGYSYTHEDLESLPDFIYSVLEELNSNV